MQLGRLELRSNNVRPDDWRRRVITGERLGISEQFPAWLESSYITLREQVLDDAYPCFFGTQAERRGEMFYAFVHGKDTAPLAVAMRTFAELVKQPAYDKNNLAVFFEPDLEPLSHQVYQDLFWRTLQELHETDWHPHADQQSDPSDAAWEFCYAGVEMFVVCACPSFQQRRSRNLGPGMVLLFQPRSVFVDKITNQVIGRRAREQVRHRLSRWDGMGAHPDLGFYGEPGNLEWKQYFLPDDNEPHVSACPFLRRQVPLVAQDVMEQPPAERHSYPLTLPQQALWLAWRMEPDGVAYNISASMKLEGELDVHACRYVWKALVQRHAILRSRFHEIDGELRQSTEAGLHSPIDWAVYDLREREDAAVALRERLHWRANQPFDLATCTPARATLVRLDSACSILQLTSHHIVADGWSFALLRKEWMECYASTVEGRLPRLASRPCSFGTYAEQKQRETDSAELKRQQAYWRRRLHGAPPLIKLPLDRPRALRRRSEAARVTLELSADLCIQLRRQAARCGFTPFTWLLAVFGVLLRQESGQSDVCIAVPLSRRSQSVERKLVGYLVNTVAVRLQMDEVNSFAALIQQAGERLREADEHADVTFTQLLETLGLRRDPSFTPICQVLFNQLRRLPDERTDHLQMSVHQENVGRAHYDLCLHVALDRCSGQLFLDYAAALFDASTAQRLLVNYQRLLERLITEPDALETPLPRIAGTEDETLRWWQAQWDCADEPARLLDSLGVSHRGAPAWRQWLQAELIPRQSAEQAREALLHGAWGLWLARSGYRRQAVFGSLSGGEDQALPLWMDVPASISVGDWLDGVQKQLAALQAHRPVSSNAWQAWTEGREDASFDSVVDSAGLWSAESAGWPALALVLSASIDDLGGLLWHWDDNRITETMVRGLAAEFAGLLHALVGADRTQPLAMLTASLADPVIGQGVAAEPWAFVSVVERIADRARRQSQAVAVIDTWQRLDYGGLERWSGHIAARLAAQRIGAENRVGVYMPRSCGLIAALLGVLKAGAAYVPLDPAHPVERLLEIAAAAGLSAIVAEDMPEAMRLRVEPSCLLISAKNEATRGAAFTPRRIHPDQLAYVIYTSGSTGKPKGVAVSHGNVARLFDATAAYYSYDENDVWALFHAYAFDVSVWEWLGALTYGGRLVVVPQAVARDARTFHRLLRTERVTVLNQTPSAFMPLMEVDLEAEEPFCEVRVITFAGEKLEPGALTRWCVARKQAGVAMPRIVNMYGITETTVHVTHHALTDLESAAETSRSLIGQPIDDLRLYLLDPVGAPTPVGGIGELWVGGPGVVRGYLGRAALTAERFMPDPYGHPGSRMYASGDLARRLVDGELEYLGRGDLQVKIRGYRVEPGELQAALYGYPEVQQAAALAVPGVAGEGLRLTAYVTPQKLAVAALREYLSSRLPSYLLPASIIALDALPLTVNGKLDRHALPVTAPDPQIAVPGTATEQVLAQVWAEVLGIDPPSVEADFFALGGHSLLALRVMSRLRERTGREAPLELLFSYPRLDQLARALDASWMDSQSHVDQPGLARLGVREAPLSFAQERLWVLWKLDPQSSAYHVAGTLQCEGALDAAAMRSAFQALVRRHEALRTRFIEHDGVPKQRVLAAEDQPIAFCWQHESALTREVAQARLQKLARQSFDLERDVLLRATLIELAPDCHLLQVVMHHIVSDGWSIEILLRELAAGYRAARHGTSVALPELPIQYADYAIWQRQLYAEAQPSHQAQMNYWRSHLDGLEDGLELPSEHDRGRPYDRRGASVRVQVPADLLARTAQAAGERGATLFMWLLTVFYILLYRYSGNSDVAVAVPWAGRDRRETEGLIGFFVNTLILRTSLSGAQSFAELLAKVRLNSIQAQAHRELPFDRLVAELNPPRKAWNHPYAQVKFLLQDDFEVGQDLDGLHCRLLEAEPGEVRFELALDATRTKNGLDCRFSYAADLYDAAFIKAFACHYVELLLQVVNKPQQPIGTLTLSEQATAGEAAAYAALYQ